MIPKVLVFVSVAAGKMKRFGDKEKKKAIELADRGFEWSS